MSEHIRFITVGFAELLANLPDPDQMASDPSLQDYWPDDHDLLERDLWDANRDQPEPANYEQTESTDR